MHRHPSKRYLTAILAAVFAIAGLVTGFTVAGAAGTTPTASCSAPSYDGTNFSISCVVPQVTVTAAGPTVTMTASASASGTPSGSATDIGTPSPTPTPTTTAPSGLSLSPVDGGGPAFYSKYASNTLPATSAFFPLGVWEEQYGNASKLAALGLNTIIDPVGTVAPLAPMYSFTPLIDEADMWAGPGSAGWTGNWQGNICVPSGSQCGYTVMSTLDGRSPAGALEYTNYGKGVEFWETDTQAAKFVNTYQQVVSADIYWATDSDVCQAAQGGQLLTGTLNTANCQKASNYALSVQRLRTLVSPAGSKPVLGYVELGHPGTTGGAINPTEIPAATWAELIAGARGIVYFNHSFGGSCQTQHVLFDCNTSVIAPTVKALNAQITAFAPVLNSPTVNGVTSSGVIASAHYDGQHVYAFAVSSSLTSVTGTITIPRAGSGTATVLGENRTVPVTNGVISDAFANSNTVHLYELN